MNMTSNDGDDDEYDPFTSSPGPMIALLLIALVILICGPFFWTSSRRQTCWRRIKEVRWDVEPVAEEETAWERVSRERYESSRQVGSRGTRNEAAAAASPISNAEKEEIRRIFLIEQLSKFTITLGKSSFKKKPTEQALEEGFSSGEKEPSVPGSQINLEIENSACSNKIGVRHDEADMNNEASNEEPTEKCMFESSGHLVVVPAAGRCIAAISEESKAPKREVPNGCAICLSEFCKKETITWSANANCSHVFHFDCVVNWFLAVGRKKRRHAATGGDQQSGISTLIKEVVNFPMECPCCRQDFVLASEKKSEIKTMITASFSTDGGGSATDVLQAEVSH